MIELGFTDRSVAFTSTLIGTSEKIRQYDEAIRKAGGTTAEVAEKQITPLSRALHRLSAIWDAFANATVPPIVESLVDSNRQAGVFAKTLATLVDIGHFFWLGWKAGKVYIEALQVPLDLVEKAVIQLGLKVADLWQGILDLAASNPITAKLMDMTPAQGILNKWRGYLNTMNAAADVRLRPLKKAGAGFWDAFLDDTPGTKFLRTIESMQEPLDTASKATMGMAAAQGAQGCVG